MFKQMFIVFRGSWIKVLISLILVSLILVLASSSDSFSTEQLRLWIGQSGWLAPLVFVAVYVAGVLLFIPGSVLTLAGGFFFGPVLGSALNLLAASIGASLAFLLSRYLAGDWVQKRATGVVGRLKQGIETEGWRFVVFTRLVPLFPFNLLNYALGLTRIPFAHYVLASVVCMAPGSVAYSWLGHVGQGALTGSDRWVRDLLVAIALMAVLIYLARWLRLKRAERGNV